MTNFATRQPFSFTKSTKRMKNRMVLAPLTHNMSADNGDLSEEEIAWLSKCAEGGFGMMITAATSVSMSGRSWQGQPALITTKQQHGLSKIAKVAKLNNSLAIVQLHHGGMRTDSRFSKGKAVAPSRYNADEHYPDGVKGLTSDKILSLVNDFVSSSKRAYLSGMDGVEIHAAFNFLLSNFSNPILNKRTDKWGGTFEKRNELIFEIVRQIRSQLPRDFIIGVRLSPENYAHFSGIEIGEQVKLCNRLNKLDIDYIHMSLHDVSKKPNHLKNSKLNLLEWIKTQLEPEINLIIAGNVSTPTEADNVISNGADLVAIGKAAIGNPDWVNKNIAGKELHKTPFSKNHLRGIGFTQPSIDYMSGISGLVSDSESESESMIDKIVAS